MQRVWINRFDTPIGRLYAASDMEGNLVRLSLDCDLDKRRLLSLLEISTLPNMRAEQVLRDTGLQVIEYFSKKRTSFDLPVHVEILKGTLFQKSVWRALLDIPFGTTLSYAQIAGRIGNAKAVRAVGSAIGKNPIAIVIPCHRVIGSSGSLCGFGLGLDAKRQLLGLEGCTSSFSRK